MTAFADPLTEDTHRKIVLTDSTGLSEGLRAWEDRETGVITIRANLHAHTTASDGAASSQQLHAWSEKHWVNIAHTDHNTIESWVDHQYPGQIAGVEVCSAEGVDVVVIGNHVNLQRFYSECISGAIAPTKTHLWKFLPTHRSLPEIIASIRQHNCRLIHAHYGNIYGLSSIAPKQQHEALMLSQDIGFVEINCQRPEFENVYAQQVGATYDLPVITTGDTHAAEWQYANLYTDFILPSEQALKDSAVSPLLTMLDYTQQHRNHRSSPNRPRYTHLLQSLYQILKAVPFAAKQQYFYRAWQRLRGTLHPSDPRYLLAYQATTTVLQPTANPETADVVGVVGS